MKKFAIIALLFLFSLSAASAQKMHRHEISFSYGWASTSSWIDKYSNFLVDLAADSKSSVTSWGGITMGYTFYLTNGIGVGASVVYSSAERKSKDKDTPAKIDNRYWSVVPQVKWRWLDLKVVSFYSRFGVGVTFAHAESSRHEKSERQFAFQASPFGVEVGGRLAAFAEAGVGISGSLLVGAKYRF